MSVAVGLAQSGFGGTLGRAGAIFVRDFRLAVSYAANFWLQLLGTVLSVGITFMIATAAGNHPVAPGTTYFNYLAINMAFFRFQNIALTSFAEAIRESQLAGTLEVILATSTSIPLLILSAGLWAFTYCISQIVVFIACAIPLGLDIHAANPLSVLMFTALTILCLSPLGVFAASMTMVFKKSGPVEFLLSNAAMLCGGVFLPVDRLPPVLAGIGWLLPITHALNGVRGAFAGASPLALLPEALWMCIAAAVLIPASLFVFAGAVRMARIDGTLGSH